MPLQVAIVGRPNVGKSSLFNWLLEERIAIVDDVAGVTRDRMIQPFEHNGRRFEIVDTGGIGVVDKDDLTQHVEDQIALALHSAALIVFVVDARSGLAPLDTAVAERLRKLGAPVLLVANKTDDVKYEPQTAEFFKLGWGEPLLVSVHQSRGRYELLDAIVAKLPEAADEEPVEPVMKLAIVGRRNVGKSTFVNILAKEERMIVSEVPGTTRDSVDVWFELDGQKFIAIDTPGLKRKKSLADDLEFYSYNRAQKSIRRADVVLMFFDSADEISRVDKKLVDFIEENLKPCIFVINKWDLLADRTTTGEWSDYLRDELRVNTYIPIVFITGKTGKNVKALINHAQMLFKQSLQRVGTGELNRVLEFALDKNPPHTSNSRRPKIFYAAQVEVQPPTIALVCNDPSAFPASYKRYLLNIFRDHLPFPEIPIRLRFRSRSGNDGGSEE